jgi:polyisoprenoid-binding protein YceI
MSTRALKGFAFVVGLALVCRGFVSAAETRVGVLELDPSRTRVEFMLGGSIHTTHGKFQLKRGTISANERTGAAEGEIVIDAESGGSGDFLRDERMKDTVLEASTWPEITFRPRHVDGHLDAQSDFQAKLEGVLTLHGARHDVVVETHGRLSGRDFTATGHLSIPYVEWGLKDPSVLFLSVAKEVEIDIVTTGSVTWQNQ